MLLPIACASTAGCNYPDEGTMPLRRALTRVQMLPETEAWERARREAGDAVQYRLFLEKFVFLRNKCHWTVEALADGKVWRRFYVSPDGKSVLPARGGGRLY
jgi:hypothetical protein